MIDTKIQVIGGKDLTILEICMTVLKEKGYTVCTTLGSNTLWVSKEEEKMKDGGA